MKKLYFSIVFALLALTGYAQTNPNRVLVREASGTLSGYLAERVDSIYFGQVEGRVAADVTFTSFSKDDEGATINMKVVNTAACKGFGIAIMPSNRAAMLNTEAQKANYVKNYGFTTYDDFSNGAQMKIPATDMTFADNSKYTIMTVGYDEFGIACGVSETEFTTPKPQIVGNPSVAAAVSNITTTSFDVTFTPNADCYGYYVCSFDVAGGGVEGYYNTMAAGFGFPSIGDMIKGWGGTERSETETVTWKDMQPGAEYEIGIQPLDVNGNLADYIVVKVKTVGAGGDGAAVVSVEVPANNFYKYDDNGTTKYVQRVIFTPNDQTNIYRDGLVEASHYDSNPEYYNQVVLFPEKETAYTNHTGVDDYAWNVDAATKYYAIAVGQNNNGEWGEITKFEFTTPDASKAVDMPNQAKAANVKAGVSARAAAMGSKTTKGVSAPKTFAKNGITMIAK